MNTPRASILAPICLVIGALLGIAGSFVPAAALRGLAWGLDGTALVLAGALLTVHHLRRGNDMVAAGFLVFVAGETLIVSGSAMGLAASTPIFAAGSALWAASLVLVSAPRTMPGWIRAVGFIAAILFAWVAVQDFLGHGLNYLSRPLPFFAYPFLAATLIAWAWAHVRPST